jgi:transglutaminase-like putative cysteine protease
MATLTGSASKQPIAGPEYVAEGLALGLHAVLVLSVVGAMNRVDLGDRIGVLGPLALMGLVLGYLLSQTRAQDLVAHSIALWTGAMAAVLLVTLETAGPVAIVRSKGAAFVDLVTGVSQSLVRDDTSSVTDAQLLVVLGVTAWLLAYSSAWVIYRRGWFGLGVAVPASILLASIRVDNRNGGWPLALFIFAAIGLAARHAIAANSMRWARRNMTTGPGLASRFLVAALPVAVAAVVAALLVNPGIHRAMSVPYRETAQQGWEQLRDKVESVIGKTGPGGGSYASFPDNFEIGGNIDLSNEVVARVQSDSGHYLALRRYDVYDGQGWSSGVQSTFKLDGDASNIRVTNVIFADSQSVALSGAMTGDREPESALITVERPKDDLIFTIETFSSASRQVYAVLGWERLNRTEIDVDAVDLASIPVDLQSLVRTVRNAPFEVDRASGKVTLTDPSVQEAFDRARQRLAAYPVIADLTVGDQGQLVIVVSGRIPNYDDIEALFTSDAIHANTDYRVVGLSSTASPDQLASASTDYPAWIANRYLQLPDSVTERTRNEAQRVVIQAGATNSFDKVWAVQEYLRSNFTYELNSPRPSGDQDWVDYFLFDHQAGRCEQFASAMIVMVRSLGIPARLVSGYNYSGETDAQGEVVYRENQAHTWVEVFFPEYGWVPFEPTTNQAEFTYGTDNPDQASETPEATDASPTPEPTVESTPQAEPTPDATPIPPQLSTDSGDNGSRTARLIQIAAILLALFCFGTLGFMGLMWQWRVRGLPPAGGLFARLQRVGAWFGVRSADSTTPYEFGRALTTVLPGTEAPIRSITNAYYAEQFDPASSNQESISAARTGWKQLRRNLLRWRIRRPKPR